MNFVYKRRGGPILSWQNGYPPRQSQAADARSLGALGDVRPALPGAPEFIATGNYMTVGDDTSVFPTPTGLDRVLSYAGGAAAGYHGYKRTGSVAWSLAWGLLGALFPIPTNAIALAQGFGKPKSGGGEGL